MEIEKSESFKEVDSKVVKLDEATKPAEKELLDANESTSKPEVAEAPKIQKKKKTRCTKCKINVGCIGECVLSMQHFNLRFAFVLWSPPVLIRSLLTDTLDL